MAEIELSVLSRQCLDRRIPDLEHGDPRSRGLGAGAQRRALRRVNWRFTTPNARIKLKRLYPSIQDG